MDSLRASTDISTALHLLPLVDDAADADKLARAAKSLGPKLVGRAEVLGKARLFRATLRITQTLWFLASGFVGLALSLAGLLGGMVHQRALRRLRRAAWQAFKASPAARHWPTWCHGIDSSDWYEGGEDDACHPLSPLPGRDIWPKPPIPPRFRGRFFPDRTGRTTTVTRTSFARPCRVIYSAYSQRYGTGDRHGIWQDDLYILARALA